MTPHIEASKEDIAPLVIMPGDPNRCKYIAEKYLTDIKLVNKIRGELAFTGYYKNKRITIFSSGMGIPSMGIYSHELFTEYNVNTIIRIGSAGSYTKDLNIRDLFLATSSYSDSNYAKDYSGSVEKQVYSSNVLDTIIRNTAKEMNIKLEEGTCNSTESFYNQALDLNKLVNEYNCKCVEMETFSLFLNARVLEKQASCILTISDSFITNEKLNSEDREKSFNEMIELALESIIKL